MDQIKSDPRELGIRATIRVYQAGSNYCWGYTQQIATKDHLRSAPGRSIVATVSAPHGPLTNTWLVKRHGKGSSSQRPEFEIEEAERELAAFEIVHSRFQLCFIR